MLRKLLAFCGFIFFGLIGLGAIGMALSSQRDKPNVPVESKTKVEQPTPDDHTLHMEPNLFTNTAVSDGRTYSVALIDANKNSIPTDTELFVQGTMYAENWDTSAECTWLAAGRTYVPQHGEIDPARYCRFSIVLTEKHTDGSDAWPGIGLVCNVDPQEMQEVTRLYHYGDEVQAHGTYGPSLDFGIASAPGLHFGVPVLEGCTFADPTTNVVRPKVEAVDRQPPTEDQPYNY